MSTTLPNLDSLILKEGGYTNDPKDKGGETIWGITVAVARAFGYTGAMKDMTRDQAKVIYMERFWTQPKFDQVALLSPVVALEMFDTGVNMGTGVASKFLQRALNVLNNGGTIFPDIGMDGALGKMSLAALNAFITKRGMDGVKVLLAMLNGQQSVRYIEIAEGNPVQETYEFGWQLNRVVIQAQGVTA